MREVAAADREAVAVAADRDHVQVGVGELHAHRRRQRAPVHAVEAVGRDEAGEAARAADAGHDHGVVRVEVQLGERAVGGRQHAEVAAARAPDRLQAGLERVCLHLQLVSQRWPPLLVPVTHTPWSSPGGVPSVMKSAICVAANGRPVALVTDSHLDADVRAHEARELAGHVQLGHDDARPCPAPTRECARPAAGPARAGSRWRPSIPGRGRSRAASIAAPSVDPQPRMPTSACAGPVIVMRPSWAASGSSLRKRLAIIAACSSGS